MSQGIALALILKACFSYYAFSSWLIRLFENDEKVVHFAQNYVFISVLSHVPDMWQNYSLSIFKALGLQHQTLYVNLVGYWLINFPLCLILTFHFNFGYFGIWYATVITSWFIAMCLQVLLYFTDWQEAVDKSVARN